MTQVRERLRKFILDNFLFTSDEQALKDEASFMESGLVDSTGILEIVNFVEGEYGINIEDDEMIPANLDSIIALTHFVDGKIHQKGKV